jgi:DNA-binding Xre family transcriptional regulator
MLNISNYDHQYTSNVHQKTLDVNQNDWLDMANYPEGNLIIRSRLRQLVAQKEIESGTRIMQKEIAQQTGLDEHTISRWMDVKPLKRIEVEPMVALLRWLGCTINELLYVESEEKS